MLATKVGRYGGGNGEASVFDFSRSRVVASVQESMRRLKVDRIDLVQCHDVEFADDLRTVIDEAIPALLELKRQGVIGAVGVTGLPLTTLRKVIEGVSANDEKNDPLRLLRRSTACSPTAAAASTTTPSWQRSRTTSRETWGSSTPRCCRWASCPSGAARVAPCAGETQTRGREAARVAREEFGLDVADLAIRDSLSTPGIASHLIGISSAEQARANVMAALRALEPATENEERAMAAVKKVFEKVQGTTWSSGKPENCRV